MILFDQKSIRLNSGASQQHGYTVWKFQDFSITQILRENNFGYSKSAKSAISTHLEDLNLVLYEFLHFLKARIYQTNKIKSP